MISFDPHLEQTIANAIHKTEKGNLLALDPNMAHKVIDKLAEIVRGSLLPAMRSGLLTSSSVRSPCSPAYRKMRCRSWQYCRIRKFSGVMIDSVGVVKL